jgi:pyocin large subunit-like protein
VEAAAEKDLELKLEEERRASSMQVAVASMLDSGRRLVQSYQQILALVAAREAEAALKADSEVVEEPAAKEKRLHRENIRRLALLEYERNCQKQKDRAAKKKDRAAKAEALFQEQEDRAAARSDAILSRFQVILVASRADEATWETTTEPSV